MKTTEFQLLMAEIGGLTDIQRQSVLDALSSTESSQDALLLIEENFKLAPKCGHCGSEEIGGWGQASGLKRYKCKACKRTFNALTGTPMAQLHRRDAWLDYAKALADRVSLRKAAKRCGIHLETSHRWRHRFLKTTQDKKAEQVGDIVEADETFFLYSKKGSREITGRAPRKRGGKAKKPGLSDEQVPVLIVRDRSRATTDQILPDLKYKTISDVLAPVVAKDAMLVSDGNGGGAISAFADDHHILHVGLNSSAGEYKWSIYHIQNVNSYIHELKEWIRGFRGVATKYLASYLGWYRKIDREGKNPGARNYLLAALA
jgi:transposase-like protein